MRPVHVPPDALSFHCDGPWVRQADLMEARGTLVPSVRWHEEIQLVVSEQEPWALLGQHRTGDVVLFDTSTESLFRCAGWSIAVRCVFPLGRNWDRQAR